MVSNLHLGIARQARRGVDLSHRVQLSFDAADTPEADTVTEAAQRGGPVPVGVGG